ncbi:MAG: DUF2752 domain-containing protein [Sandaracinaceae bacterium]|nr:DUF2752 domain-containing protein [Sandaracinaceae bacterium]
MSAWFARRDGAELFGVALAAAFVLLVAGAPVAISVAVSPEAIERGEVQLTPPCPVRASGAACPTCGLTRGFAAMSRLRIGEAHAYHGAAPWLWLGALTLTLGAAAVIARVAAEARGRRRAALAT